MYKQEKIDFLGLYFTIVKIVRKHSFSARLKLLKISSEVKLN